MDSRSFTRTDRGVLAPHSKSKSLSVFGAGNCNSTLGTTLFKGLFISPSSMAITSIRGPMSRGEPLGRRPPALAAVSRSVTQDSCQQSHAELDGMSETEKTLDERGMIGRKASQHWGKILIMRGSREVPTGRMMINEMPGAFHDGYDDG
ncbi:hypothetical protein BDR06DRAFT_970875 [Suillus hirtellus]|nr:hypothetical protein BDR06DRAFT_970875 [Suillus hirtellus]